MRKVCRRIAVCLMIACFFWIGTALADKQKLRGELIRIHVVANSDSPEDQRLKLSVRDAVLRSLKSDLEKISDAEMAHSYLEEKLPYIQRIAQQTMKTLGCENTVKVTLQKEAFEKSGNSLYSLPAGIYDSLRIIIGEGQGMNWWSVLFSGDAMSDESDTGILPVFSEKSKTQGNITEPEIRFWFLDILGKMENIFFGG